MHISDKIKGRIFEPEMEFSASRSSGPGGQNVNKVNSRVTLRFDIQNSQLLEEEEKVTLLKKLQSKLTTEGVLIIDAQEKRSQFQNKAIAIDKFYETLDKAFRKRKRRIATKPSKTAIKKRLESKKQHSEKKANRKRLL
ncbi:aminoacyl-tRNA hydrolase [Marivirga sp. S37H4]|uniref:Aminoacyl-tRNA hydrolase n=1 Tax=Marivirga aurantiaca TaxID=2802615 RepID=A0A934WX59_9BACT|nr:alternative ribosome rescue aminoacyl-tRNA hydrolase ArfB [Marivirga aurantiaca]MBK6264496.1 aminoacyl-tRNA hydrolase [Marivirga aurantiaca]